MYRSAAKRLLLLPSRVCNGHPQISGVRALTIPNSPRFSSTSASSSEAFPNFPHQSHSQNPNFSDSSSQSPGFESEDAPRHESQTSKGSPPRAQYQEEQARVLSASLRHVPNLGWTEAAMIAGAREAGVSPSIIGSFLRKEAALVEV